ncbi:MAG TPA: hypothetical protein VE862_02475 [Candidatus Acidoferrum sp.]|nr:hypothetical protein [Candidatus Acidoferrum sp.]
MDTIMVIAEVLLVLAGLTGVFYGVAINVPGMMTRGATDYSFITAYITEWSLVLIADLALMTAGVRRKV